MKKELRLLSLIFSLDHVPETFQKLENIIGQNLDWNDVFKIIVFSDIAPLSYYYLARLKNNNIPAWFMQKLSNSRNSVITANMFLWKNLGNILRDLNSENISIILLKGAFMSDIIYENIAMRSLVDIDIMVKEKDLPKIDAILKNNSYAKIKEYPGEILYRKEKSALYDKLPIEIHYRLRLPSNMRIPVDFLWNEPITKESGGLKMLYPSIENSIIYSALHFFHHLSEVFMCRCSPPSLKSIMDIHEIISKKNEQIYWDKILKFSKSFKMRHVLYISLFLSKIYFGTRIPENVIKNIKPDFIKNALLRFSLRNYINMLFSKNTYHSMVLTKFIYLLTIENYYFLAYYALKPVSWIRKLLLTVFQKPFIKKCS